MTHLYACLLMGFALGVFAAMLLIVGTLLRLYRLLGEWLALWAMAAVNKAGAADYMRVHMGKDRDNA